MTGSIMDKKISDITFYWLPVLLYCLLIYIQSSHDMPEHLPDFFCKDKLLHFAAYAVLGMLVYRALLRTMRHKFGALTLISGSIIVSFLYGLSDEIHQYYVSYRHADVLDALADLAGSVCGVYIYHWLVVKYRVFSHKFLD